MDITDEEDEEGDGESSNIHHKTRERDSLEDLRVTSEICCVVYSN